MLSVGISPSLKLKDFNLNISINKLQEAFMLAETILNEAFIGKNKVKFIYIFIFLSKRNQSCKNKLNYFSLIIYRYYVFRVTLLRKKKQE